jgi:hypothetical protein
MQHYGEKKGQSLGGVGTGFILLRVMLLILS